MTTCDLLLVRDGRTFDLRRRHGRQALEMQRRLFALAAFEPSSVRGDSGCSSLGRMGRTIITQMVGAGKKSDYGC